MALAMTLKRVSGAGWQKAFKVILQEGGLIHFGTGKRNRARFINLIQEAVTRSERNSGQAAGRRISQLAFAK